ncbi:metal-sulfur cluster assembly factor [Candidatus Woesearchaeota archaeon]|jgi:metal-sulfur cluster biosynthetic enzyme|nr:metal-sulfur cluster assembly factor [Candidatus Woesearchaeota archaeon]
MITTEQLIEVFKSYQDPELGIDIWTLGLIYKHEIDGETVNVEMTFTSPFCPFGPQMVEDIENLIKEKGAKEVKINISFDPPWEPSEELKAMLGMPS